MAKPVYECSECGAKSSKWTGQCPECQAWNTLTEAVNVSNDRRSTNFSGFAGAADGDRVQNLSEVKTTQETRIGSGIKELDHVLGGGLVSGSAILIGGNPGIGKSTLLLQALASIARELPSLYVTGEESPKQIALRAQRLGLESTSIRLVAETCVERIVAIANQEQPRVLVVDSIQTVFTETLQSAPGAVAQVRESAALLVRLAKRTGTILFLVGHVTKEGQLAGPRVLEHMVDTVLYFEGDPGSRFRVIRAVKNRYGAVNELGVFAMSEQGLREVSNPSALFLSRHKSDISGSAVMVTLEGTRPLLVEVQALVDQTPLGNPRRVTQGLEQNRLNILLAVLHRHGGIALFDQDVYINVVGGVKVSETAADLPLLMAILSSFRDRHIPRETIIFGEVGLAGEIRPVPNGQERLKEAAKHGFKRAIIPADNKPRKPLEGFEVIAINRLSEALELV